MFIFLYRNISYDQQCSICVNTHIHAIEANSLIQIIFPICICNYILKNNKQFISCNITGQEVNSLLVTCLNA